MPVIRINRPKDYVVMNKHLFREREMSLKAKGLLGLMLTLPEDYTYTVDNLVSLCKEGATAVESALSELKDFGYLVVVRIVNSIDAMTASVAELPWEVIQTISKRITSEISEVTHVALSISDKPPATIEFC